MVDLTDCWTDKMMVGVMDCHLAVVKAYYSVV